MFVVSKAGPAMKVFFSHEAYRFHEDRDDAFVIVVAEAAAGMPRAATVDVSVRSRRGTARSPNDYEALSASITLPEEDFALENGSWQLQYQLPVTLVDDEIREGTESFDLVMEHAPGTPVESPMARTSRSGHCRSTRTRSGNKARPPRPRPSRSPTARPLRTTRCWNTSSAETRPRGATTA